MGELTDKDILCGMFGEKSIYTPKDIRNIIRRAPAYKGQIELTTMLERKVVTSGKAVTKVAYACIKCNHALDEWTLPQEQKYCFHCGRKVVRLVDAPDALEK